MPAALARAVRRDREDATRRTARFAVGDTVRCRHVYKTGHTRLPRYLFGRQGVIAGTHGMFVLPDSNAHGLGENPEWAWYLRFTGAELWAKGRPDADRDGGPVGELL